MHWCMWCSPTDLMMTEDLPLWDGLKNNDPRKSVNRWQTGPWWGLFWLHHCVLEIVVSTSGQLDIARCSKKDRVVLDLSLSDSSMTEPNRTKTSPPLTLQKRGEEAKASDNTHANDPLQWHLACFRTKLTENQRKTRLTCRTSKTILCVFVVCCFFFPAEHIYPLIFGSWD